LTYDGVKINVSRLLLITSVNLQEMGQTFVYRLMYAGYC